MRSRFRKPVVVNASFDISSTTIGVGLSVIAIAALWAGVVAGAGHWNGGTSSLLAAGMFALLMAVFGGPVAWLLGVRRAVERLAPADELCSLLHVDHQALERRAESRGIRPRYIVNGCPYYEPADFGESACLLRGSLPPLPDSLLRPAADSVSDQDRLLHPAHPQVERELWS